MPPNPSGTSLQMLLRVLYEEVLITYVTTMSLAGTASKPL